MHYTRHDQSTGRDMSEADNRIAELLDRWLASVELHSGYVDLDDAAYAQVQDWPRHQRPTRWIVDLARARLKELQIQLADRQAAGDRDFAEALELMSFLTTLLGFEHVERFIPLAMATESTSGPPSPRPADARGEKRAVVDPTVIRRRSAVAPDGAKPRPAKSTSAAAKAAKPDKSPRPDKAASTVIADAVRLLSWGREWPQLAGLIARLADRPSEQEVWVILRAHRATIEARAASAPPRRRQASGGWRPRGR